MAPECTGPGAERRGPRAAHLTLAGVTQYLAWVGGYVFLLTGEYPRGLLGDAPEPGLGPAGDGDAAAARKLTSLLVGLGLTFASQYNERAARGSVQHVINQVSADYQALGKALQIV